MSLLTETIAAIRPADAEALAAAQAHQAQLTKPAGSMGLLEPTGERVAAMVGEFPPPVPDPVALAVFAGDHGVQTHGVSRWPQEVSAQMALNIASGGAVVNAMCRQVGADVVVVDVGLLPELPDVPGLLRRKIASGTGDMTVGPAMTEAQVHAALEVGIGMARDLVARGTRLLLVGEVGIGNTTPAAALVSVFTGQAPAWVTGYGAGLDDAGKAAKIDVIETAIAVNRASAADPIAALAAVGGLEHAAMVGYLLGAAALCTPVVLDGVIACAAAVVATALAPDTVDYLIAGHSGMEPGIRAALAQLGLRPLIDLDLRLGEGSGAALAVPVVQASVRMLREVATFASAGVSGSTDGGTIEGGPGARPEAGQEQQR